MLSPVMEDYLKTIYVLQDESNEQVSTSEISDYLDVASPTVTSMIGKLDDHELVEYEKYKGVTLTEKGEVVALKVIRHHRLLEAFLTDHFNYDWDEVHKEADQLEHHVSNRLIAQIAELLENPNVDPHGDPIPDATLQLPEDTPTRHLDTIDVGDRVVVQRIRQSTDAELRYLAEAGIRPETTVEVIEVAPFGMVTVSSANGEQGIPEEIARRIEVVPATDVVAA